MKLIRANGNGRLAGLNPNIDRRNFLRAAGLGGLGVGLYALSGPSLVKEVEAIVADFHKANPGIRVEPVWGGNTKEGKAMKLNSFLFGVLVALALAAPTFAATPDPQILVGVWKGELDLSGLRDVHRWWPDGPERILIIDSVNKVDDGWAIAGRFGLNEKRNRPEDIKLAMGDNSLTITVAHKSGNVSRLTLLDSNPNILVGTFKNKDNPFITIKLRRAQEVPPKVSDPK